MTPALPPLSPDDFGAFFRAVHGHDPFPWQQRLVGVVRASGWPAVLDLPTGSGKTAVVDIALFALALDAGQSSRSAPLRIVYVVDRRTIVDQAYRRAELIREALSDSSADVVRRVRERLDSYGAGLGTALLRGGIARDESWARRPDQPLVVVSTVDQVGSRLLFRGYGVTDSMKPVHAGLLGQDVLYLLDEVHLSNPFRESLSEIGRRYRNWAERPIAARFVVVEMSATPGTIAGEPLRLDEADREHPRLAQRLRSSKPARLVSCNPRNFPREIEQHVLSMLERPGAAVAVVVNRVASARELHGRLCDAVPDGAGVHLLTGRMRPFDRDAIERSLIERIRAGRTRRVDDRPIVIVATQAIEAGADFDFDGLVTECASLDALRQRFGRLDRLGDLGGEARGVIVARSDALRADPVYGEAIGATWGWLQEKAVDGTVDFGIEALVMPDQVDQMLAPKAQAPILLPAHLDAWVQTSPRPEPDPDVALWLHGPRRGTADVQVVWRADLSEDLLRRALEPGVAGSEAAEIAVGTIEALPPVSAEAMSVPLVAARHWLSGQSEPPVFDVEGAEESDEQEEVDPEPPARPVVLWQGERSTVVMPADLRPGQTVVVPATYGGVAFGNWAPAEQEPVVDVAEVVAARQRGRVVVRLHPAVVPPMFGSPPAVPSDSSDSGTKSDRQVVVDWLATLERELDGNGWGELIERLRVESKRLRVERLTWTANGEVIEYFVVTGPFRQRQGQALSADDLSTADESRSSLTGVPVSLASHLDGVAKTAADFGRRLGLPDDVVGDLRLAGQWHDAGKADPRFQRWLHGGSEFKALVQEEPLAKSAARLASRVAIGRARQRAGYPEGYRHELMSLALMSAAADRLGAWATDWTLVTHLVASHHGQCRPFAPWVSDPSPVDVTFLRDGIECSASSEHEFARLDSGVADRFWEMIRRYGWWGAAYLEALFRLADHRQSEREQDASETGRA